MKKVRISLLPIKDKGKSSPVFLAGRLTDAEQVVRRIAACIANAFELVGRTAAQQRVELGEVLIIDLVHVSQEPSAAGQIKTVGFIGQAVIDHVLESSCVLFITGG